MAQTHDLKIHPDNFAAFTAGKRADLRKDDRAFKVGDVIRFRGWNPDGGVYTGRAAYLTVSHIDRDERFGVPAGWCLLSLR
jgi:hypothetical protein